MSVSLISTTVIFDSQIFTIWEQNNAMWYVNDFVYDLYYFFLQYTHSLHTLKRCPVCQMLLRVTCGFFFKLHLTFIVVIISWQTGRVFVCEIATQCQIKISNYTSCIFLQKNPTLIKMCMIKRLNLFRLKINKVVI